MLGHSFWRKRDREPDGGYAKKKRGYSIGSRAKQSPQPEDEFIPRIHYECDEVTVWRRP